MFKVFCEYWNFIDNQTINTSILLGEYDNIIEADAALKALINFKDAFEKELCPKGVKIEFNYYLDKKYWEE